MDKIYWSCYLKYTWIDFIELLKWVQLKLRKIGTKGNYDLHILKIYRKAGLKARKAKYKTGYSVRIWKKRGTFHRGYMEDFTRENFILTKVLTNLPVLWRRVSTFQRKWVFLEWDSKAEKNQKERFRISCTLHGIS